MSDHESTPRGPVHDDPSGIRRAAVIATVVAALVGAVAAVCWVGTQKQWSVLPWTADAQAVQAVTTRVDEYVKVYNTYDVADPSDYQERMKPLLTSAYNKQFVEVTDTLFTALKDRKQVSSNPVVQSIAVQSIDSDSATALVAADAQISAGGEESAVRRFRWVIDLRKQGGSWKVSDSQVVAPGELPPADGATPTPSADGADQ